MAMMERRREKKSKPGQGNEPAINAQSDIAEPVDTMQETGESEISNETAKPIARTQDDRRKPISLAELEPVLASSNSKSKPRPIPVEKPTGNALTVEPKSMELDAGKIEGSIERETSQIDELSSIDYEDLTDIEKDVLKAAKDALKKKRYEAEIGFQPYTPMVEKIVGDCLAKYQSQKGYTKDAIVQTLKDLEEQRWIVTAERRTKDDILTDEIYQKIISFLEAYPGTHARDDRVQQQLAITRNPFLKHVLVLDRFNLVQKKKFGKLWNFFAPSFKETDQMAELIVILYNDIVRQLVKLLIANPSSTLVDLAKSVIPPVYHGAIQYHLKKLEELGLVVNQGKKRVLDIAMLKKYNSLVCDQLKIAI